jgi:hypothetical protein
VATFLQPLLLKQDLIDADFIRAQNQRIFAKLDAVQDERSTADQGILCHKVLE